MARNGSAVILYTIRKGTLQGASACLSIFLNNRFVADCLFQTVLYRIDNIDLFHPEFSALQDKNDAISNIAPLL